MIIKQKFLYICASFLAVTALVLFGWLPSYVEKTRNHVLPNTPVEVSAAAKTLHSSLFIADLHSDSLLWNRNLAKKSDYGHVDIPRLIEGNVGLQVFSVVTKTPKNLNLIKNSDSTDNITLLAFAQLWPPNTWGSLFERAVHQANKLHRVASTTSNFFVLHNQTEFKDYLLQRKNNPHSAAGLLSLEGAHALEGKLENLDQLHALGFRIIGFSHFFDNELGGSAHGINKEGITEFGKQVLQRMHELEMFVDIAHASPALINDIFTLSKRPILATHTGVQGVCPSKSNRNLSDKQIKQIAASDGVIGIGFWPTVTCGKSIAGIVESIRYVSDLVGINYVGLGSDFDGNVSVPFTSSNMQQLTHALLANGFTQTEVRKIMGENLERLFSEYLSKQ